jgi:hypothetical protein
MDNPFDAPRPAARGGIPWPAEPSAFREVLRYGWPTLTWLPLLGCCGLGVEGWRQLLLFALAVPLAGLAVGRAVVIARRERRPPDGLLVGDASWSPVAFRVAYAVQWLEVFWGGALLFLAVSSSARQLALPVFLVLGGLAGVYEAVGQVAMLEAIYKGDAPWLERLTRRWASIGPLARLGRATIALVGGDVRGYLELAPLTPELRRYHLALLGEGEIEDTPISDWPPTMHAMFIRLLSLYARRFLLGQHRELIALHAAFVDDLERLPPTHQDNLKLFVIASLCELGRDADATRMADGLQHDVLDRPWLSAAMPSVARALERLRDRPGTPTGSPVSGPA